MSRDLCPLRKDATLTDYTRSVIRERFFSKVRKTRHCWVWTGRVTSKANPYGLFNIPIIQKTFQAHRFSYILAGNLLLAGHHLHHNCLNPTCVKPSHLVPMTPHDHMTLHKSMKA